MAVVGSGLHHCICLLEVVSRILTGVEVILLLRGHLDLVLTMDLRLELLAQVLFVDLHLQVRLGLGVKAIYVVLTIS